MKYDFRFEFFYEILFHFGIDREMNISKDEKTMVLKKLCEKISNLQPNDLPTLSFQLFSLCTNAAQVIIPIFSLNNYFHRNYYKKVFGEMCSEQSNTDIIGENCERGNQLYFFTREI